MPFSVELKQIQQAGFQNSMEDSSLPLITGRRKRFMPKPDRLWQVVERDLPDLALKLERILSEVS